MDLSRIVESVREWWKNKTNRGLVAFGVGMLAIVIVLLVGLRGCGTSTASVTDTATDTTASEEGSTTTAVSEEAIQASTEESAEVSDSADFTVEPVSSTLTDGDAAVEYETILVDPEALD